MQLTVANIVALIVKLKVRRMLIKKKNESERETVTEIQIAVTETVKVTDTNTLFLAIFGSVIFLKLFLFNLFFFCKEVGGLKPSQLLPQHGPCSAEVVFQVFLS